ncbi:glycosyltransferase family 2 protein [Cognatishimia sp. SS12]|uniref:glycosyltransferase family 2 protein n=1 Tax=Cognatishimia sp. SS12 TaxID=2979465 RepID=UPI00232DD263|nr:glycosyltransferase family 2 protein [Cognatishimia sp. SS12]MDC0737011.1 glycosyltransferase family 2 protein [Cognatishimia sp. SS12]
MTAATPRWGIVTTIKAPTEDTLNFVAYHLDLGADHIFVYLDDANAETAAALAHNPAVTTTLCDDAYWQKTHGRRPKKHQVRQVQNASRAYRQAEGLDWLAHIDVDEFLCPTRPMAEILAAQPADMPSLRVEPVESLCDVSETAGPKTYCKTKVPAGRDKQSVERALYPNFGGLFKDGFISHTAGKVIARTGHADVKFGIHRIFQHGDQEMPQQTAPDVLLCHRHVESWEKWLEIMQFRLTRGSYRAELTGGSSGGRITRHALFSGLTETGEADLRAFFEEVCLATPRLLEALEGQNMLRVFTLDLAAKRAKHFPDWQASVSKTETNR